MRPHLQQVLLGPHGCLSSALADGEEAVFGVSGTCMEPDLLDRDAVRLKRARYFLPGDVVAFHCPHQNRFLVHRFLGYVHSRGAWKLMTMADRGSQPDPLVDLARVIGRVTEHGGRAYRVAPRSRLEPVGRYTLWCARFFARRIGRGIRTGALRRG